MRSLRLQHLIFLILLAIAPAAAPAVAQMVLPAELPVIEIDPQRTNRNLTEFGIGIVDVPGADIRAIAGAHPDARLELLQGSTVNLGMHEAPLRVTTFVRNASTEQQVYVLEILNPRLERVAMVQTNPATGHQVFSETQGAYAPRSAHDYYSLTPAFKLVMQPGELRQIDLLMNHTGALRFGLVLWPEANFLRQIAMSTFGHSCLAGALLILFFGNLIVFLGLRERPYAYLTLMIFALLLYFLSGTGLGNLFLWEPSFFWSDRAIIFFPMIVLGCGFLFTAAFFGNHLPRRLNFALRIAGAATILASTVAFSQGLPKYWVLHSLSVGAMLFILGAVLVAVKQNAPGARHYLAAWTCVLMGSASLGLLGLGLLPYTFITEHLLSLSFAPGAVIWNYALTSRIKKREQLAREVLEKTVAERTAELTRALSEVKQLSGLLPICSHCKKIRDDRGYWSSVEAYLHVHTDAQFTHGICPDCTSILYPEFAGRWRNGNAQQPEFNANTQTTDG